MPHSHANWPPLKKAIWKVLMDENLNDGHYIKAFDLVEKLYKSAVSATSPLTTRWSECPNCHDANSCGNYQGPVCEVCDGRGWVENAQG